MALALALAIGASPAGASLTIGQTSADSKGCEGPVDVLQPTVTAGNAYVVPSVGTITSWSHQAGPSVDQIAKMKVFRKVADPSNYQVVGHDGPRSLTANALNTFATNIPVMPGDVLGMTPLSGMSAGTSVACRFDAPGETQLSRFGGDLPDGVSAAFTTISDHRLNASAVVTPSNAFTLGDIRRNKKRGTAILTVDVPNPGALALSGKGLKTAGAAGALAAKTVPAAGEVKLKIKAKGKKKRRLNKTGKVKVKPQITYTPTNGDPSTQSLKRKLKKRL